MTKSTAIHVFVENITFSDLRQDGGFLHQKTVCHDITEILLKVALNTTTLTHSNV